jgi:hypothetical protein
MAKDEIKNSLGFINKIRTKNKPISVINKDVLVFKTPEIAKIIV